MLDDIKKLLDASSDLGPVMLVNTEHVAGTPSMWTQAFLPIFDLVPRLLGILEKSGCGPKLPCEHIKFTPEKCSDPSYTLPPWMIVFTGVIRNHTHEFAWNESVAVNSRVFEKLERETCRYACVLTPHTMSYLMMIQQAEGRPDRVISNN